MAEHIGDYFADSSCSHPLIKTFGVRIGGEFQFAETHFSSALLRVRKECAADSLAHPLRIDPHVFDLRERVIDDQRATSGNRMVDGGNEDPVIGNELRRDRQFSLPVINPLGGIIPMPLGQVSKPRQRIRFIRSGRTYFQLHLKVSLSRREIC